MLPFGETVLAWRLARGLSQAALARAAGMPRPNLSGVERGEREVTLKTLRALALALDVRPGILVDGTAPEAADRPLSRARLERIAKAAARGTEVTDSRESALARDLERAISARMEAAGRGRRRRAGGDRAYFLLRTREAPATIASLIDRASLELERR